MSEFLYYIRLNSLKNFLRPLLKHSKLLLAVLLGLDVLFIVLHFLHEFSPYFNDIQYSIERDQGYAEIYSYFKWLAVIITLCILLTKSRDPKPYIAWILVFAYCLIDDAKSGHETLGIWLSPHLENLGIRNNTQDLAELLLLGFAGISIIVLLALAYNYGRERFRIFTAVLFVLFVAFAFFGIVVDLAHSFFQEGSVAELLVGTLEDGGEMMIASVMLAYVILHSTWVPLPETSKISKT